MLKTVKYPCFIRRKPSHSLSYPILFSFISEPQTSLYHIETEPFLLVRIKTTTKQIVLLVCGDQIWSK